MVHSNGFRRNVRFKTPLWVCCKKGEPDKILAIQVEGKSYAPLFTTSEDADKYIEEANREQTQIMQIADDVMLLVSLRAMNALGYHGVTLWNANADNFSPVPIAAAISQTEALINEPDTDSH